MAKGKQKKKEKNADASMQRKPEKDVDKYIHANLTINLKRQGKKGPSKEPQRERSKKEVLGTEKEKEAKTIPRPTTFIQFDFIPQPTTQLLSFYARNIHFPYTNPTIKPAWPFKKKNKKKT